VRPRPNQSVSEPVLGLGRHSDNQLALVAAMGSGSHQPDCGRDDGPAEQVQQLLVPLAQLAGAQSHELAGHVGL
jgi:hypothetical protein